MRAFLAIAAVLAAIITTAPAAAQTGPVNASAAPATGTAQRRAILDALRPAVERRLGPGVEFVVTQMRVRSGWAFVMADPQRRGGRPIDGRRYFGEDFDNMDGLTVTALLRFNRGWTLVDHAIGATDAWYCDGGPSRVVTGC
jgi:hypothetical protein